MQTYVSFLNKQEDLELPSLKCQFKRMVSPSSDPPRRSLVRVRRHHYGPFFLASLKGRVSAYEFGRRTITAIILASSYEVRCLHLTSSLPGRGRVIIRTVSAGPLARLLQVCASALGNLISLDQWRAVAPHHTTDMEAQPLALPLRNQ